MDVGVVLLVSSRVLEETTSTAQRMAKGGRALTILPSMMDSKAYIWHRRCALCWKV